MKTLFDTTTDTNSTAAAAAAGNSIPTIAPAQNREFELALRQLIRRRLSGELNFEDFARENLELHFRYGRPGYDVEQYERDIAEHRERQARHLRRQQLDEALRCEEINEARRLGA